MVVVANGKMVVDAGTMAGGAISLALSGTWLDALRDGPLCVQTRGSLAEPTASLVWRASLLMHHGAFYIAALPIVSSLLYRRSAPDCSVGRRRHTTFSASQCPCATDSLITPVPR
jgi:hypothetical protein